MFRYYIFKDGDMLASTATREQAISLIHQYQEREDWYIKSNYSIIAGEEEFIPYEEPNKKKRNTRRR